MKVPFLSFSSVNEEIKNEIMESFRLFFDSEYYILGNQVDTFEKKYAELNQSKFAIGVANGLDALHIALKSLNIQRGDEVIVPSNTYIATVLAISLIGAKPIFVEPNILTYNLDPKKIIEKISPKTRAIMPVHLYGQACEMEEIMKIADHFGLYVVEDNAQAHLAAYKGQLTGTFGHINGTSFYPTKNLGAFGDAGAITTNDLALNEKARRLRNYGSEKRYYNEVVGLNSRLDELQASFLNVKLKYLPGWTHERIRLASLYSERLNGKGDIILPYTAEDCFHVYHLFVIRSHYRDELQRFLNQHEIGTLIHYPVPPHLQNAYLDFGYKKGDFPIAEEIADTCLSLPLFTGISDAQIDYVCEKIIKFFN